MAKKVSDAFVNSQKVNPNDFLTDGETSEQAKVRIASVVAQVVKSGLSMRDGELHFGVSPSDMADAKTALGLLKDDDTNYMRHANDSLVNAIGAFVHAYQSSQMGPEKNQDVMWGLQGLDAKDQLNKMAQSHLKTLNACLDNMYERGFDKDTQPRRWDSCGDRFGRQSSGVSAQQSLAPHRTL